jgi:hypothetical protein
MQYWRKIIIVLSLGIGATLASSCTTPSAPRPAAKFENAKKILPNGYIAATPTNADSVIIGLTSIELGSQKPSRIGVQVDRVVRDINDPEMWYGAKVPADALPGLTVKPVPYMEGERVRELLEWSNAAIVPLGPAKAIKAPDGKFYASNGRGEFVFQILPDKLDYSSVSFVRENGSEYAIIPDTHGFNSIAGAAIEEKKSRGLDLALACMDDPAKVEAALYLARNGISCYAPCDRYASTLMAALAAETTPGVILGGAPVIRTDKGSRIGGQPIIISLSETLIAQTCDAHYPHQYYDTPARYFRELSKAYGASPKVVETYAIEGQTWKLTKEARDRSVSVIAARIYVESDYTPLKLWMEESSDRRLVLFHSAAYEFGIRMFREYPERVSFGDLYPVFARRPK